jgi:hypothetical protein
MIRVRKVGFGITLVSLSIFNMNCASFRSDVTLVSPANEYAIDKDFSFSVVGDSFYKIIATCFWQGAIISLFILVVIV